MAGIRIPVMSKRTLSFDTGAATVVLRDQIPVLDWVAGALFVRVHATTVVSSSEIAINAYMVAPTAEDPAQDFVKGTTIASLTIDQWVVAPTLLLSALGGNPGPFLRVVAVGTPSGGTCSAVLSIELVLKADDRSQPLTPELYRTVQ